MNRHIWIATEMASHKTAKSDLLAAVFFGFLTARRSKTKRFFRMRRRFCRRLMMNRTRWRFLSRFTQRFTRLQERLTEFGIPFQVDDHLVRGLDYYDNIVFEFGSSAGAVAVGIGMTADVGWWQLFVAGAVARRESRHSVCWFLDRHGALHVVVVASDGCEASRRGSCDETRNGT